MTGERRLDARTAEQLERVLRSRRTGLAERVRGLVEAPSDATCQAEMDAAQLERVGCQIEQVERALARLSQGDYGWCHDCGGFIGLARLRALPFTRRCQPCQIETGADVSGAAHAVAPESAR
jgi:DnaK suppressor protein